MVTSVARAYVTLDGRATSPMLEDDDSPAMKEIEEKLTTAFFEDEYLQEYARLSTVDELKGLTNELGGSVYDEVLSLSEEARLAILSTFDTNHLVKVFIKAVLSKLTT
ncbi:MAG: hypothetical protein ACRDBG_23545 [Waterburya sp.]